MRKFIVNALVTCGIALFSASETSASMIHASACAAENSTQESKLITQYWGVCNDTGTTAVNLTCPGVLEFGENGSANYDVTVGLNDTHTTQNFSLTACLLDETNGTVQIACSTKSSVNTGSQIVNFPLTATLGTTVSVEVTMSVPPRQGTGACSKVYNVDAFGF